jgi:hypothetical protein
MDEKSFPGWITALEQLMPSQIEVLLCVNRKYQIAPGDFVDQAISEKLQRSDNPEIRELLAKIKKPAA